MCRLCPGPPAGVEQRGHFNLIHVASGMKADIYCANSDPLHH
jgi:hypothetical protein